ncbi:hypothetical protein FHG89_03205 [Micromonospora orduensis]|uniref:Putative glycogen debranching enzyme N-terminal domain-containing protein n=1 Tax=Micromonospora orduensis TaxID=1420891 RepID=A0A5C4QZR9_9ACTN|nr:hypothetical protein FHG89_03205 [Micromonospora orduensis]
MRFPDSGDQRSIPPDLGPDSLAVLSGPTFLYSNATGDVPPGSIGGLVHLDTRLISGWSLTVNGGALLVLRAETIDHYSAQYVLSNPELPGLPLNSLGLRRLRYVGDGFHERVELISFRLERVRGGAAAGRRRGLRRPVRGQVDGPGPLRRDHTAPRRRRLRAVLLLPARRLLGADPGVLRNAGGPHRGRRAGLGAEPEPPPGVAARPARAVAARDGGGRAGPG